MLKRLIYILLVVAGFAALGGAIWFYYHNGEWLARRDLERVAFAGLFILGVLALIMPFHLRYHWESLTPAGLAREYLVRGGMVAGVLGGLFLLIFLAIRVITLPAELGRPGLILPWLLLLVPLGLTFVDLIKEKYAPTPANLAWGLARYAFQIYALIGIQLLFVPIALVLFPVGILLKFLSLVDIIVRQFNPVTGELPLLCSWAGLETPFCTPALLAFHVGYPVLALLGMKYGEHIFDRLADWYAAGMDYLSAQLNS